MTTNQSIGCTCVHFMRTFVNKHNLKSEISVLVGVGATQQDIDQMMQFIEQERIRNIGTKNEFTISNLRVEVI